MKIFGLRYFALALCVVGADVAIVQAQDATLPMIKTSNSPDVLLAQATSSAAAMQAAIDARDSNAIISILNATPRGQRGSLASMLLAAAQSSCNNQCDKQFAASLAALAFVSGGLTPAQQNVAIIIVRGMPAGLFIVERLLSNNLTGGFGFGPIPAFSDLIIAETPLQGTTQGIFGTPPQGNTSPN